MHRNSAKLPDSAAGSRGSAPVVVYDGGCPLCRREILHYRGLGGAQAMEWVDIVHQPERLPEYGLTAAQAMESFHVRDGQGRWHQGAAAFVVLWSHLRGYRWLALLVRSLRLTGPLQAVYRRWAAWRLRRRCRGGECRVRHD